MDLSGRGVFLTGGSQGFGRCATAALLEKGAKVLFCGINTEVGKATEEELQKQYGADNVAFVKGDVTDANQLKAAFEAAVSKFGAVDICANNAGIMDERDWEKMLATNTTAQIRGSQLAFEHMRRDKGGRGGVIINTVSVADPEMSALGVRWCCLCPNAMNTAMLDLEEGAVKNVQEFRDIAKTIWQEPEVVAKAFVQMLQDVDSNGKIMVVGKEAVYRKRILVDEDEVSDPLVDGKFIPE
ncbi:15-hydroxyprostaglandin dehydrogenase [NAD(+)]-like [Babylonia areolata]|uniref:15-hydroxyprostaglandin dehydrogenase [NAD(+)]-like n=1 Tax=Babylonia areolata TaxID=304850 RepID=UPI003FD0128E